MRYLLELLILVVGLGAAGYLIDRYIKARRQRPQLDAYFSGGPLDGETRTQRSLPETLTWGTHIYHRNHLSLAPPHSNASTAIYQYLGEATDPDALSQEAL